MTGRVWHELRDGRGRPFSLLAGVLVFLLASYWPAHEYFRSAGDVGLYQDYARAALERPTSLPREYPPATLAIFLLPELVTPGHYLAGFVLLTVLASWLTVVLVDRRTGRGWWLIALVALGSWATIFYRFDILVVLLTVLAFVSAERSRWLLAQTLLVLAVALKLYALILLPLVVLWQWRVERRAPLSALLGGGLLLLGAAAVSWLAAPDEVEAMLRYHLDRPLEIESTGAALAWLLGSVTLDRSFGSVNLLSSIGSTLTTGLAMANVLLLLGLYAAFARGRLEPATAWALALTLAILTNKVFSTQYLLWPLPFVVLAGSWCRSRAWRWLWGLGCLLTGLIYPPVLHLFMHGQLPSLAWPMSLISARNLVLLLACLAAALTHGAPGPHHHRRA